MKKNVFLVAAFCAALLISGCSTPNQSVLPSQHQLMRDVSPGSIVLNNTTPYTLLVNGNKNVGPKQSAVLTDCSTNGITDVNLEMKAYQIGQIGCILTRDYKGSTTSVVTIGPESPPIVVTVSTWNLK